MDETDHFLSRYKEQVEWYDKKSVWYKNMHVVSQVLVITLSATTPVLILIQDFDLKMAAIVTSTLVSVIGALVAKFKIYEVWIGYRAAAEEMKKEYALYIYNAGHYHDTSDKNRLFVERIEDIIASEHDEWKAIKKEK